MLWGPQGQIRQQRKWLYAVALLAGFAITTLETVCVSNMNHTADKSFISAIGSAGNLIMAACMFSFALSIEDFLQKRASYIVATLINKIGVVTMSIYFINVIFLRILNYATRN